MGLLKIIIPPGNYSMLLDKTISVDDLLLNLFAEPDTNSKIVSGLNDYHSNEDGAPIVSKFEIAGVNFDDVNQTGQVKFAYKVDFTFACADKRATTNHYETSNFHIVTAAEQTILNLFIHDKVERDTVNEF